jgi:hypothetical protein
MEKANRRESRGWARAVRRWSCKLQRDREIVDLCKKIGLDYRNYPNRPVVLAELRKLWASVQ